MGLNSPLSLSYESIVQTLEIQVIKDEYGILRNDEW
jgi:hypothetical protein